MLSTPTASASSAPIGRVDGIDVEPAQGRDEGDRDPVQAGEQGQQDGDLNELCAMTEWHRKALAQALRPKIVRPRKAREPR